MIDLPTIRARDARLVAISDAHRAQSERDVSRLLQFVDALVAAARKVTCWRCHGVAIISDRGDHCPDCADLRALLEQVKP